MLSYLKKYKGQYRLTLVISLIPLCVFIFGLVFMAQEYLEKGFFQDSPGVTGSGAVLFVLVWVVSCVVRWIIDGFKR